MLSVVLTVSTHALIWVTTYYSCIYMPSQSARHAKWVEKNTRARANQNARVQFVETKDTRVLFVQTMMHTAAD